MHARVTAWICCGIRLRTFLPSFRILRCGWLHEKFTLLCVFVFKRSCGRNRTAEGFRFSAHALQGWSVELLLYFIKKLWMINACCSREENCWGHVNAMSHLKWRNACRRLPGGKSDGLRSQRAPASSFVSQKNVLQSDDVGRFKSRIEAKKMHEWTEKKHEVGLRGETRRDAWIVGRPSSEKIEQ